MIRVQHEDFDMQYEYQQLLEQGQSGAVVMFCGLVREFSKQHSRFELQHYPGMTENVLQKIDADAQQRWPLLHTQIIHRVGELNIDDQIVFVGVSSKHRSAAFAACEYMIDLLKTEAPFWKKEGDTWVDAKDSDAERATRWMTNTRA